MPQLTRRRFLAGAAAAAAAACAARPAVAQPASATNPASRPTSRARTVEVLDRQPIPPDLAAWRSAYGANEGVQKVRRVDSGHTLLNPHMGTTTFQRFNGDPVNMDDRWNDAAGPEAFGPVQNDGRNDHYPQTTVAYCRWLWSRLEPERGKFHWDFIDGALKAARDRGQTLQVRVQPFIGRDIPQWHLDTGGQFLQRRGRERELDHNTDAYLAHWGGFIAACGKRYDGHPDLESFDIAYGGSCGETGGNCTPATAARLVDVYLDAFRKTQLVSMLGTAGCTHAATAKDRNVGWRADCFGDLRMDGSKTYPTYASWNHMYDAYPTELFHCGVEDAWKTAPVTFETCWTVGHWLKQGWDVDWILAQGLAYHMSVFMPKSSYIPDEWREKFDAFNRKIGYRFVLRQLALPLRVRPRGTVRLGFWIENVGVAPIYRPYKLAVRLRQGDQEQVVPLDADLRQWLPGHVRADQDVPVPEAFGEGIVSVDVAIVDPATRKPAVKLAIAGIGPDGWYPMTFMEVTTNAAARQVPAASAPAP